MNDRSPARAQRRVVGGILVVYCALLLAGSETWAEDVRIGVLGLFHPQEFTVSTADGTALVVHAGQESFVLEKSSSIGHAEINARENGIVLRVGSRSVSAMEVTVSGRTGGSTEFLLTVPGKITRRYRGTLVVKPVSGALVAVVGMDLETAVESVVAAESLPGAPAGGDEGAGCGRAIVSRRRQRAAHGIRFLRHDALPVFARTPGVRPSGRCGVRDSRSGAGLRRAAVCRDVHAQLQRAHADS